MRKVSSEETKLDKKKMDEKKHVKNNRAKRKWNVEEYVKRLQKKLAMLVATSWSSLCSSPSGTASPSRATGAEAAAPASRAKAGGARAALADALPRCAAPRCAPARAALRAGRAWTSLRQGGPPEAAPVDRDRPRPSLEARSQGCAGKARSLASIVQDSSGGGRCCVTDTTTCTGGKTPNRRTLYSESGPIRGRHSESGPIRGRHSESGPIRGRH